MPPIDTAYTALESLLLFQGLRAEGVKSHTVFNRVSEQLKNITFVRDDPSYDSGRLSPDALRELYLSLLKEEVKRDLERQLEKENLLRNGSLSPASRKRKAPSPDLPTVHEASQHAHLIPQLVTRLYARYREHAVRNLRDYERKYLVCKREIQEIENGEWDERLQRQRVASKTQSPRPPASAQLPDDVSKSSLPRAPPAAPSPGNVTNGLASSKPFKGNKIGDVINHGPEPADSNQHRRTSSGTVLPPLSEMAPQSPRFGIPPKVPGPLPSHQPHYAYTHSPPSGHQSPYASHHGHPVANSLASPQLQHALSRPSSSPRPILPPPAGMKFPQPSPGGHVASSNGQQMGGQYGYAPPPPHRLSIGTSPTTDQQPRGYPPPQHYMPQPQQVAWQHNNVHMQPAKTVPQYQSQYGQYAPPLPTGAYHHPPYGERHHEWPQKYPNMVPQPAAYSQPLMQHPQYAPSARPTAQKPARSADPLVSNIISALATPPRKKLNATFKHRSSNLHLGSPRPSPSAYVEPVSPQLKRTEPSARSLKSIRKRGRLDSEPSAEPEPESAARSTRARGRPKRERSPHSVVSSTADDSTRPTRSQSVSTAAGALPISDDRPGSRSKVKVEPSTPAAEVPDVPSASSGRRTRKRAGTLQSQAQPSSKRTRRRSLDREASEDRWPTPQPRPSTVTATRNFHKMSATVMNDINSHKHAAYFANPVRDKDAPGYSAIVKQPQNLKSIRTAIAAGAKAVNAAAAASAESPSAPDSATIELERTIDLIPPKSIVNGAQLEKEVMRMLANAALFNPGEDGMVKHTREMFEDVSNAISMWRGAEKEAGGDVEAEEDGREKGKRRKL